jgi:hypothetical protein
MHCFLNSELQMSSKEAEFFAYDTFSLNEHYIQNFQIRLIDDNYIKVPSFVK